MSDSGKQCQSGESDFKAEGLKPTGTGLRVTTMACWQIN